MAGAQKIFYLKMLLESREYCSSSEEAYLCRKEFGIETQK